MSSDRRQSVSRSWRKPKPPRRSGGSPPALVKRSFLILHCCRVTATAPRVSIGCLALLLGVLFSTTADAAGKRVGVPKFDGAQEALVRKKVMQVLKRTATIWPSRARWNRPGEHGRAARNGRRVREGRQGAGAVRDRHRRGRKEAGEDQRARRHGRLAAGRRELRGRQPAQDLAEVGRDFWKKLGADLGRAEGPFGRQETAEGGRRVARGRRDTPDAAGGEGSEPTPEPETKKKAAAEPVAAAEGGEGEEPPKKKKKKKTKTEWKGLMSSSRRTRSSRRRSTCRRAWLVINAQSRLPPGQQHARGPAAVFAARRAGGGRPRHLVPDWPVHRRPDAEPGHRRPRRAGVLHLFDASAPARTSRMGAKLSTAVHEYVRRVFVTGCRSAPATTSSAR